MSIKRLKENSVCDDEHWHGCERHCREVCGFGYGRRKRNER